MISRIVCENCKDIRNILEYFGRNSYIYDGNNRSFYELICNSLT